MISSTSARDLIRTLVFFDLETTGLDVQSVRITELAAVAVKRDHFLKYSDDFCVNYGVNMINNLKTGQLPRVMSKLCLPIEPDVAVPIKAAECSGLTTDLLKGSNNFKTAFDTFSHFLNRLAEPICLIAHNGSRFDFKILNNEICRNRLTLTDYPAWERLLTYDTMFGFKRLDKSYFSTNSGAGGPIKNGGDSPVARPTVICAKKENLTIASNNCSVEVEHTLVTEEIMQVGGYESSHDPIIKYAVNQSDYVGVSPNNSGCQESEFGTKHQTDGLGEATTFTGIRNGTTPPIEDKNSISLAKKILSPLQAPPSQHSLGAVFKRFFGEEIPNAHSADGDCLALLRISLCYSSDFVNDMESKAAKI